MTTILKSKRIGMLVTSLMGAGTERTILTLAKALVDAGCQVDLFVIRKDKDYELPQGVNYICLNAASNREARRLIPEIVKGQGYDYDLFVISNAKYYPVVPVKNKVCSVHITPTAWITGPAWKFWSRMRKLRNLRRKFEARPVIALSRGIYDDLTRRLHVPERNARVIVNPFDFSSIRSMAAEKGPVPEGDYIVSVASLTARKRLYDLLRAFAAMKHSDVSLVLVGKGSEETGLRAMAEQLGVSERVIFWGWEANPYRLLKNARLSVLASEAEGSPRVVVESLIVGTPVVSTDCPSGPAEILTGDLKPFLVKIGDIRGLSEALDRALDQYPEITVSHTERFDSRVVAQRYLELSDELSAVSC